MASEDYRKIQDEMRSLLKPALNAFMSKYKRAFMPKDQGKDKRDKRDAKKNKKNGDSARRACDIAVVVDHLFFKEVRLNRILFLFTHSIRG